jgi:hypothetical protein
MITYRKARKLLGVGDVVFSFDKFYEVTPATVHEICDGWLETDIGILDFDDHGYTWWLTQKVAMENVGR